MSATNGASTQLAKPAATANNVAFGNRGLELRTLDDMWRFANCVAKSGLAPKGVETPEAIVVAVQMGAEIGLTPMASLQNIAVINGRPSLWGDAMLAVCRASGVFDESQFEEIVGDTKATCTVCRIGGKPITRSFSIEDAKRAGLLGKSGPWSQYTQRMLQLRARSFALRDGFGDFLRGTDTPDRLGPRRATAEGWLTPGTVQAGAWFSFALAFLCGVYLVWHGGWPIVAIGLASLSAGWAYRRPKADCLRPARRAFRVSILRPGCCWRQLLPTNAASDFLRLAGRHPGRHPCRCGHYSQ